MSKPLRALIVEDSADDTELLVYQLERGGYDVTYKRVDNAANMSQMLQQEWDIVLADYAMPSFSATEALKLLKASNLDIPFVIVSGSIGDGIAVTMMKAGASDYLLKNNLARLVPAVERELHEAANRRSLQESEDRWQLALRGSNDGIWDWDISTNTVFFSPRWKEMLGYAAAEIGNAVEEWLSRIHPEDLDAVNQAITEHFANKTEFYSTEHRLLCKDGNYKWILSRGQALWNGSGQPVRMVGSHTDISDRKQMEAALRRQAEFLLEANRLKDEFLAIVSHELRTPLNSMLGWSQLLRQRQLDAKTIATALESIERNAKLQKQLVQDLLDVSRIIRGKMRLNITQVNPLHVLKAALDTVKPAAEAKEIQLVTCFDPTVGFISGDSDRLQQVLWNLLINAIKFTPHHGTVELRLSVSSESEIISTPPSAIIEVIDTGIGIHPEFLPYVFDRFRQQDSSKTRSYGGLGLGLSIVRHLVELHGGTVTVHSPGEGQGTTFTVTLPLLEANHDMGELDRHTDAMVATNSIPNHTYASLPLADVRVLVVDDDADTRHVMLTCLAQYGAEVQTAESVPQALALVADNPPHVLVTDIAMPSQDGYILLRQLTSQQSESEQLIPVVALSAYARDLDRSDALSAGFAHYLYKPVDIGELVTTIADLCGRNLKLLRL